VYGAALLLLFPGLTFFLVIPLPRKFVRMRAFPVFLGLALSSFGVAVVSLRLRPRFVFVLESLDCLPSHHAAPLVNRTERLNVPTRAVLTHAASPDSFHFCRLPDFVLCRSLSR